MKVTRKTREQAARICSAGACQPTEFYYQMARELRVSPAALRLATAAFLAVFNDMLMGASPWHDHIDAEAEAMLRTGWTP